ncbi:MULTISPECIES: hypothetical protein [unclassified Tenacibaculum]|uniref:hypothetical protein n=1 Tax=unclassified Tenacibaculum TaxID=2635139 RepID=UPI001F37B70D|nr:MULTISPECIES: hypothetical protein [unclassified Tenacibaculum]MCF2876010.1 hypothetical protein [Tenacibaculum sp. Cn5-1]MCF2936085.1 hypothetical protein [Tenacibaculum sp. Cn5-34]MCG7512646.1 hypothetical protein [Tenacibaculum sp. Cn5-46]
MLKKLNRFIILIFIIISCNKEETEIVSELKNNLRFNKTKSIDTATSNAFQAKLQWISFLVTETIIDNPTAKEEFINILNNSNVNNVIRLNDLFNPNNLKFMNGLKKKFDWYQFQSLNDGTVRPHNRPRPGSGPTHSPITNQISSEFELYINSLLNEDCLELYLPNGIPSQTTSISILRIISSAHPLNNSNYNNEAYDFSNIRDTKATEINDTTRSYMIITRPFRNAPPNNCNYQEYIGIDFKSFLN